ncbi:MAG: hypothetical protein WKF82_13060 [Nocardioidaceae bacterium]
MIGALKYEWLRIRTIASSYWMSGLAIVLSAAICLIMALILTAAEVTDLDISQVTTWVFTAGASAVGTPVLAAMFFAIMGVMAMGHEYRYGTNKATLSALPDRPAVLVAKLLILALWVTATVAIILLVNFAITSLFLDQPNFAKDAIRPVINYWLYCVGFAWAGLALAAILRSQAGAIVAVLVWPLVIEPIVLTILRATALNTDVSVGRIYNLLPASAGRRTMFSPYELFVDGGLDVDTGAWGLAASTVVFWVAILGLIGGGTALFLKRDA